MVGGYIIDKYGIVVNFSFTVLVQICLGTMPLLLIRNYVPDEKDTSNMAALWADVCSAASTLYKFLGGSILGSEVGTAVCEEPSEPKLENCKQSTQL